MCNQCLKNPVYEFTNKRKLCKTCFVRWFESKFLYTLRKFEMLKKGDVVAYENRKRDFRTVVLIFLLEMFSQKGTIKLVKSASKKCDKIALADTSDAISFKIIGNVFDKKLDKEFLPVGGRFIRPLFLFLDKEVLLYAKIKKLKFERIKEKKNELDDFVNSLEEKHPEIKHSIVQSYLKIFEK